MPTMPTIFKQVKSSPEHAIFRHVMHLLRFMDRQETTLLLAIIISFLTIATSAAEQLTPPSQITALNFAYHTMTTHTCEYDKNIQNPVDVGPTPATCEQLLAIIRTDYRILKNGMASVWMELLTQPQTTSHIQAPITHTTLELELLSTTDGNLLITTTHNLTSKTWEAEINLNEALTETRLRGLVYNWLALFEQPDSDETLLLTHTRPSTTLDPATGPRLTGYKQIRNWFTSQRQRQKNVRQHVETIDITPLLPQHYRLDFAVDWQARGTNGALHIGRKEYRWEVELNTDGMMFITHIQERDTLPLPNMGTRIFC